MNQSRKTVVQIEEITRDIGREIVPPTRKITVAMVIDNPAAGRFIADLTGLYDLGADLAKALTLRGVAALGINADQIEAYGKGAIVGMRGELEHAAALLHPRFGAPLRATVNGEANIPSTKKRGGPGSTLVIPVGHKHNIWDWDHMDATEIAIPDAPGDDEIVIAVALCIGGRPLHRIGPVPSLAEKADLT